MTTPPVATRVCRFCQATIPAAARVCPDCQRDITGKEGAEDRSVAGTMPAASLSVDPAIARVSVVDVDMPFASMVWFMVKWTTAAIPALLILSMLTFGIFLVLALVASACGVVAPPRPR